MVTVLVGGAEAGRHRTTTLFGGRWRGIATESANSVWYYCRVMARVTFSLDDATVAQIRQTAARLQRPQSHVVRDAVADYAARTDRLSERERQHLMGVLERLRGAKPTRPATGVDAELRAIRTARRVGGRRHPRA